MRGVLLLLAMAASGQPAEVPLPEGFLGAEVDGGVLFHVADRGGRTALERFDLDTRRRTVLYAPRSRRAAIVRMQAGGGVVAVEVIRGLHRDKVLALDSVRGAPVLVASGRTFERRDCGRDVRLEDVSESGDILVSQATVPCERRRGTFLVRAFRRTGAPLTLERHRTADAFIGDGSPYRTLQGNRFLTWGDRHARLLDLESGQVRRFEAPGPAWFFGEGDVAADGRVLLNALRGGPEGTHQRLLLDKRVVFDSTRRSGFATATFCGRHAVMHELGRARERLSLLDPPLVLREGRPLALDYLTTCDSRQFVFLDAKRERALVYDLPE
jgi:hypothetical protein